MDVNWKDFGITFLLLTVIVFLVATFLSPYDFLNITEELIFLLLIILFSSISLIYYIKRNKPAYKEVALVSFLAPFLLYILYSTVVFYFSGTLDYGVALVLVFALLFVASPILTLYLRKKPNLIKLVSIFLILFLVFLFYTGMIFFLIFWFGLGILFAVGYVIMGLFWKFLLEKTGMQ